MVCALRRKRQILIEKTTRKTGKGYKKMSGTRAGGLKAAAKNKKRQGKDYYRKIGRIGGSATTGMKGFALSHKRAVEAGALGGSISKRGTQYSIAFIRKTLKIYRKTLDASVAADKMGVSRSTVFRWDKIY